jgi:hypothetical protein
MYAPFASVAKADTDVMLSMLRLRQANNMELILDMKYIRVSI